MSGKFDGKIALITGGSSGMALATAERFVEEGALVYITGRRQQLLDDAVRRLGPRLRGISVDAAELEDIEMLFTTIAAEAGRLDILYASAGIGSLQEPLAEVTPAGFDEVFGLNVRGTLFAAQRAAALMTEGGSIILNGSAAAEKAMPGSSLYAASKAALRSFARVWSAELSGRGIRVNVLHPGPIDTPALERLSPEARNHLVSLTTLGRLGQAREVAGAVLFLASADAGFVSGTELFVSGGMGQS
ncbi:SDR family NAD(P)-dependent oxidoreductase [Streptomyces sp. NPDC002018]|uniref:SDR family NAD(P)-dependent oxidoreductase n=1 Tax=Streptomyces sp. NPDC002018 TaxID=3364629 RepID=UPI0036A43331